MRAYFRVEGRYRATVQFNGKGVRVRGFRVRMRARSGVMARNVARGGSIRGLVVEL